MGDELEIIRTPVRFDIFTRQWNDDSREWEPSTLKAVRDPDGKMRLNGIASSTIKDLHGDTMLLSALEDMERAANNGLTIFGNHSYEVPEDVYGTTEQAVIKQAGTVDGNGDPIYDLRFAISINDENERAVKTWKAIHGRTGSDGAKLGLSIGAMIPEGGAVRDKKSGAYTISHVDLVETSIVGIPANPRSWVENAMKSLNLPAQKAAKAIPVGQPQLTLDAEAGTYMIEGRLDGIHLGVEDVEITTETVLTVTEAGDEPVVTETVEGSTGGGDQTDLSSNAEPEVTDSKIRVIEIDTGDDSGGTSSQGASTSEPAPAAEEAVDEDSTDETGEVIASVDEIITEVETVIASTEPDAMSQFQQLLELSNGLNRELAASMTREHEAAAAKAQAEQQRDEIAAMAGKLISGTSAILNKLADQPVGRRTAFREVKTEFEGLEGTYSSDFLSLLRSKNT